MQNSWLIIKMKTKPDKRVSKYFEYRAIFPFWIQGIKYNLVEKIFWRIFWKYMHSTWFYLIRFQLKMSHVQWNAWMQECLNFYERYFSIKNNYQYLNFSILQILSEILWNCNQFHFQPPFTFCKDQYFLSRLISFQI